MKTLCQLFLSFLNLLSFGQCDINTGCAGEPFLNIDPPIFDATTSSIILNNVTFGGLACTSPAY